MDPKVFTRMKNAESGVSLPSREDSEFGLDMDETVGPPGGLSRRQVGNLWEPGTLGDTRFSLELSSPGAEFYPHLLPAGTIFTLEVQS